MAYPLSESYIEAKNRRSDPNPWVICLEIFFSQNPSDIMRLVNNTDDIVWNGNTYIAFPFEVETIKDSNKAEVQRVVVKVSNVNQAVQYYAEEFNGGVGANISFAIVYTGDLAEVDKVPVFDFIVIQARVDNEFATFTLGAESPYSMPDPRDKMLKNFCRFQFPYSVDHRCPYTAGVFTQCNKTLADCIERNGSDSKYTGLFPLLGKNVVYVE